MKTHRFSALGIMLTALLLLLRVTVVAQDQNQDQNDNQAQDPPSRVARLNHGEGSVSFQPGGEGDWVQAVPNRPLTTGDNLWADQNSKAELHVGSTALRIGSETSLTFLQLDNQTTQLKLSQGSLIVRVRHLDDGDDFEIDTPNLAFIVQRAGEYRIDVNADGTETETTVWHGRGEVVGGGSSYTVVAGQYARFNGTDELNHSIEQIPGSDDLDNWAFNRDANEDRSESANYVSTEMTGYEDLDDYGSWHYVAEYGPVWTPRGIDGEWAPYRRGHWAWVGPWGWTWVEDEPWGFAPFHYGRWAYVSDSWCWVPGPVVVRPVYAPALVAFVGGGGFGVSVGIGGGVGVGWFPLAPREVYVPWYRTSPRYVNNVNITNTRVNVTQVTNVYNTYNNNSRNVSRVTYVNQHVNNATTVVSHDTFVNARQVHTNIVRVDPRQLEQAQVVRTAPVQPIRASVMGAGATARFRPPVAVVSRQVVATRNPTPPRQSFEQRQVSNVRTENPGTPQPAGRMGNEPMRGNGGIPNQQPAMRTNEAPQPGRGNMAPRPGNGMQRPQEPAANIQQQNVPRSQDNARSDMPRNDRGVQPERQIDTSRAQAQREQNPLPSMNERNVPRPQQPVQNEPSNDNRAVQQQPMHPLVRQAPPVQERPDQQRNEEQKFNNWQQQHQAAAPREVPRPAEQRVQPQERPQPQQPRAQPQEQRAQPQQQRAQPQKREPHQ